MQQIVMLQREKIALQDHAFLISSMTIASLASRLFFVLLLFCLLFHLARYHFHRPFYSSTDEHFSFSFLFFFSTVLAYATHDPLQNGRFKMSTENATATQVIVARSVPAG